MPKPDVATRAAVARPRQKTKRTAEERALIERVCRLWADLHDWPTGQWPKSHSWDAILIGRIVVRLGAPFEFYQQQLSAHPHVKDFTYWMQGPRRGEVGRLEEAWLSEREHRYTKQKQAEAQQRNRGDGGMRSLAKIIREAQHHA